MKSYRSYITVLTTMVLLVGAVFATSGQDGRKSALDAKYNVNTPKGVYEARVKHHALSIQEERIKHSIHETLSISDEESSSEYGSTRACEFDQTAYGAADCDAAWTEFSIDCADLEANYGWDCAGCDCPGDVACEDQGLVTCDFDGSCAASVDDCPGSCEDTGDFIDDCSGDGDCCPLSWIGDGFEDCEDQAYGCDLTCYDDDGGDCGPVVSCEDQGLVTCPNGSCAATEADCPEPSDCEFDWTAYGAADCDAAWTDFGINCADLEANYGWDCAGCLCPGDSDPVCGDGSCNGDETFATCPQDCSESGCDDNTEVLDCADDDCCPMSWIGDGFEDCEDQAYGCDLTCYDMDGGDCGPVVTCEDQGLVTCWDSSCAASEADCPEMGDQLIDCAGNVWDNSNTQYAGDGDADGDGCMDTVYDCVIDNGTCEDIAGNCYDATGACTGEVTCPDGMIGAWTNDTLCDDGDFGLFANCEELCFDGGACGTMPDDDCTIGDGSNCATAGTGDVNFDGASNVLDIVQIVNYILGSVMFDDCQLESADLNGDGAANVLDIVAIVNVILDGRSADATKAGLIKAGNALNLSADGYIGGVQMTLSHGADFSIELTDKAMVADYRTDGNETTLIIVAPESDELFIADGEYDIVNMIVANSAGQMDVSVVPNSFVLSEAYPNPFNPSTTINLSIPEAGYASVMVYNVMGQLVSTLADGHMDASDYSFTWDASAVPSGVYLITAATANQTSTQKVMFLK